MNHMWILKFISKSLFKKVLLICLFGASLPVLAQDHLFNLIPKPVQLISGSGSFTLNADTKIFSEEAGHTGVAALLAERLKIATGYSLSTTATTSKKNTIRLVLMTDAALKNDAMLKNDSALKNVEGAYVLAINKTGILIKANQPAGWFYGIQTLMQLLEPKKERSLPASLQIPVLTIRDYPRFQWRGLMVDVSRHFFSKDIIKRYIDQMAKYKFNTLHLHLTDNQGWRIEIESLPKLTAIGAWRVPRTGYWKNQKAAEPGEKATAGGFYSKADIKEIVAYAQQRFVQIVPEIDVPGHSLAMIAAYPELSCTKTPQQVLAGDPWNPTRTNVLCVGNEAVFTALDQVITAVAALFPSKYIHIGGDEVTRNYWEKCELCQDRIKDQHLSGVEELQSYFLKRVAQMVIAKGKVPLGWYENLPGGLPASMTVMSWKDDKGGILSSNQAQDVIMTPAAYTYLDFYQGDPYPENAIFSVNRLSTTFQFNPLPKGINAARVLGGQGSLWTEQVPNERKLQAMTWPRGFALAEVLWSGPAKSSWTDFITRVEAHLPVLDRDSVNYSRYFYDAVVSGLRQQDKKLLIKLSTELDGLDIHYAFDDTDPDQYYPKYAGLPLEIPKGAQNIRVITYRAGKQVGRLLKIPVSEIERRTPVI